MTTTGDDVAQVTTQDTGGDAQFTTQAIQDAGDDQADDGDTTTLSANQVHLENNRPPTERPILSVNTWTCITLGTYSVPPERVQIK